MKLNTVRVISDEDRFCFATLSFLTAEDEEVALTTPSELMIGNTVIQTSNYFVNLTQEDV